MSLKKINGVLKNTSIPAFSIGSEKGQLFSTDALLALVIFAFAIVLISTTANQMISQSVERVKTETLHLAAERVAYTLLSSAGNPRHWDTLTDRNSVYQIGLRGIGSEISTAKWNALRDWNAADYYSMKRVLGVADQNISITISDTNKTLVSQVGIAPLDSNRVTIVSLPSVYQSRPVLVSVQVYG